MTDNKTLCRCGHRRLAHTALKSNCTYGHHPSRNEPGWEQYRQSHFVCPCEEFKKGFATFDMTGVERQQAVEENNDDG